MGRARTEITSELYILGAMPSHDLSENEIALLMSLDIVEEKHEIETL